jgi:hypothetical protein
MHRYLSLLLMCGLASAGMLITNGEFEQEISDGWTASIGTQYTTDTIDRAVGFNPDPDFEARVKKYDATHAKLHQTVSIPSTMSLADLEFMVDARLSAREHTPSAPYWAAAAILIRYIDDNDNVLGDTRICWPTPHCFWTSSSTVNLILAADTSNWYNYSFNVNDELANVPGVNPPDIAKIQVALFDTTNGC